MLVVKEWIRIPANQFSSRDRLMEVIHILSEYTDEELVHVDS